MSRCHCCGAPSNWRALMLALHQRALRSEGNIAEAATAFARADRELDDRAKAEGADSESIDRAVDIAAVRAARVPS